MIALASDHAGLPLKQEIMKLLDGMGLAWQDFGTYDSASCDYPVFGYRAAKAVSDGRCEKAVLVCGTGEGIGMAASKVKGTRVCICSDPYSAELSRRHNDSNVLSVGARVVGVDAALGIVKVWLETAFEGGRHARRIALIADIEAGKEL